MGLFILKLSLLLAKFNNNITIISQDYYPDNPTPFKKFTVPY